MHRNHLRICLGSSHKELEIEGVSTGGGSERSETAKVLVKYCTCQEPHDSHRKEIRLREVESRRARHRHHMFVSVQEVAAQVVLTITLAHFVNSAARSVVVRQVDNRQTTFHWRSGDRCPHPVQAVGRRSRASPKRTTAAGNSCYKLPGSMVKRKEITDFLFIGEGEDKDKQLTT